MTKIRNSRHFASPSGVYTGFFSALQIFAAFVNFVEEFNPEHISKSTNSFRRTFIGVILYFDTRVGNENPALALL